MNNSIVFITDEGEEITFYIEEETRVNGVSYLLVTDSAEDDANAYILKDESAEGDEEAQYTMVDDDDEFDAVADLFRKLMDDVDLT